MGKGLAATGEEAGLGDLAGMDRIDPDIPRRELQDGSLGQPAQPPFAGGIGGIVMRGEAGGRRDVDDRAGASRLFRYGVADRRGAMLHAEQWPSQIDRERPIPRLDGGADDVLAGDRAGIVDQDVQATERGESGGDDLLPRVLARYV